MSGIIETQTGLMEAMDLRQVLDCASAHLPLPTTSRRHLLNPNGIPSVSPGLRVRELPWVGGQSQANPERVASRGVDFTTRRCNPVGVEDLFAARSQGSSRTRNPGLVDSIPLGLAEKQAGVVGKAKSALALLKFSGTSPAQRKRRSAAAAWTQASASNGGIW